MSAAAVDPLSRRERQIMDVVYARGQATVAQVQAGLADPPSYSAVRALMRILEAKGHLRHEQTGMSYLYIPVRPRPAAARSALRQLLATFFDGSPTKAVAALLDVSDARLTPGELDKLQHLIESARRQQMH